MTTDNVDGSASELDAEGRTDGSTLRIDLDMIFGKKQQSVIDYSSGIANVIDFYVLLGQYGSGKSLAAGVKYLEHVAQNGFHRDVHEDNSPPTSAIVAPTYSDIMDGPYKQLRRIVSDDLITNERLYHPFFHIEWVNGHITKLCSVKGAINGPSWTGVWIDEIQEKAYEKAYHNIQARVRDGRVEKLTRERGPLRPAGKLAVIIAGLAQRNHVEDLFRYHKKPSQKLVVMKTEDNNHNLGGNAAEELRARMPDSAFEQDDEGWTLAVDVLYPWFNTQRNVDKTTRLADLRELPAVLGVDLRKNAAVSVLIPGCFDWAPDSEIAGLLVDEWLPQNYSAKMIALEFKSRFPWQLIPGRSKICMDPTASIDEVNAFRAAFPGVEVIQYLKGFLHKGANGVRAVATALRDERQLTRLKIAESLDNGAERGTARMFREWNGSRDGRFEHIGDAVRYATQVGIPDLLLPENSGMVRPREGPLRVEDRREGQAALRARKQATAKAGPSASAGVWFGGSKLKDRGRF